MLPHHVKECRVSPEDERDSRLMAHAVRLSAERMQAGAGGPFGAVIAIGDDVVAEGWNEVTSTNDPTAHAEVVAIRRACARLQRFDLRGATLYTSCEPCPMCFSAAYWARVDRIVYANTRDDAAAIGFDDAAIYQAVALAPHGPVPPCDHRPAAAARAVFDAWLAKPDRIPY
jgi:tRNA(Arg) A34 adenosine deaminase TadA